MTSRDFIIKWRNSTLSERVASQSHFNDLCCLLREPTPTDADPEGTWYAFEKGALKTGCADLVTYWFEKARADLDSAMAAAYRWEPGLGDEDVVRCLLALNREWAAHFKRRTEGCTP